MRRAVFVVNPLGLRNVSLLERRCRESAGAHGWEPWFIVTEASEGGSQLGEELRLYIGAPGDKIVFVIGGDGTARACARYLSGTGIAMAIIPRGTANLFARALGVPADLRHALEAGFGGQERRVDLALAGGEPFVAMAGMGVDAAVVHSTPQALKHYLGWAGYAVAALPHLAGPDHELTVRLDGARALERRARAVVVGNVGILPGGFTILPGAALDDGLLDVAVLAPAGLAGWAVIARRAIVGTGRGRGANREGGPLEHFQASSVEIEAAAPLWFELDGDVIGHESRLSVSVLHQALVVKVPGAQAQRHDGVAAPHRRH